MFTVSGKVLLTGGNGFLGGHVFKKLVESGVGPEQIIVPRRTTCDLRKWDNVATIVKGCQVLIHLAGNVGGIGYNQRFPATLFYDNIMMGVHLIEAARLFDIEKLVLVGTVCSYPKYTQVPFKEEDLWRGYPEETNAAYGIAKKALLVMADAYRRQYGLSVVYLIPANLYGPGDNFDPERSHVIPALIKRFSEAVDNKLGQVTVWGTGEATREFLYVEDAAEAITLAMKKYDKPDPVNIGSSEEISIRKLVDLIAKITGYKGEIVWDKTRPDGQPRRKLDTSKAWEEFGFKAQTSLVSGLSKTIEWYNRLKSEALNV
jgi:GDP-L-fucose synthase